MTPANACFPIPGSTCRYKYWQYPSALGRGLLGQQVLLAGGPGGEQLQTVGGRGTGCGGIDIELQPGFRRQWHRLEIEIELTDHGMVEPLAARTVVAHILRR